MEICQRYIISLDGPVVTLAGFKDELAVVTHSSPSLPSDEQVNLLKKGTSIQLVGHVPNNSIFFLQMLEFRVLNIRNAAQQLRGRLPLTPGSCLTWFGFSEEGQLSAYDSKVHLTLKMALELDGFLRVDSIKFNNFLLNV